MGLPGTPILLLLRIDRWRIMERWRMARLRCIIERLVIRTWVIWLAPTSTNIGPIGADEAGVAAKPRPSTVVTARERRSFFMGLLPVFCCHAW